MGPESKDQLIFQAPKSNDLETSTSVGQALRPVDTVNNQLTAEFPVLSNTQKLDIGGILLSAERETLRKIEDILADLQKQPENPRRKVQALGTIVSLLTSIPDEVAQQIKTVSDKADLEQETLADIKRLLSVKQRLLGLLEDKKERLAQVSKAELADMQKLIIEAFIDNATGES